jgi:hypothetical protein
VNVASVSFQHNENVADNSSKRAGLAVFILFSIPKITITADVVEFTDAAPGGDATPK